MTQPAAPLGQIKPNLQLQEYVYRPIHAELMVKTGNFYDIYAICPCSQFRKPEGVYDDNYYSFNDDDLKQLEENELFARITSLPGKITYTDKGSNAFDILSNNYFNDFYLEHKYSVEAKTITQKITRALFKKSSMFNSTVVKPPAIKFTFTDYQYIIDTKQQLLYKKEETKFRKYEIFMTSFEDSEEKFDNQLDNFIFALNEAEQFDNPVDKSSMLSLVSPTPSQKLMLRSPRGNSNKPEMLIGKYEIFLSFYRNISQFVKYTTKQSNYLVIIGNNSLFNQFYFHDTNETVDRKQLTEQLGESYCDFYDELNNYSSVSRANLMNLTQAMSECFASLTNSFFEKCSYYRDFQRQLSDQIRVDAICETFSKVKPVSDKSSMQQYIEKMMDFKVVRFLDMLCQRNFKYSLNETLALCEQLTEGRVVFRQAEPLSFTPLRNKKKAELRQFKPVSQTPITNQVDKVPLTPAAGTTTGPAQSGIQKPAEPQIPQAPTGPMPPLIDQCKEVLDLFKKYNEVKDAFDIEKQRMLAGYFNKQFVHFGYAIVSPCMCDKTGTVGMIDLARIIGENVTKKEYIALKQLPLTLSQDAKYLELCMDLYVKNDCKPVLLQINPEASLCILHQEPERYIKNFKLLSNYQKQTMVKLIKKYITHRFDGGSFDTVLDNMKDGCGENQILRSYCTGKYNNYYELIKFYREVQKEFGNISQSVSQRLDSYWVSTEECLRDLKVLSREQKQSIVRKIENTIIRRFQGKTFEEALNNLYYKIYREPEAATIRSYCVGKYHNYYEIVIFYKAVVKRYGDLNVQEVPDNEQEISKAVGDIKTTQPAKPQEQYQPVPPQNLMVLEPSPIIPVRQQIKIESVPAGGDRIEAIKQNVASGKYLVKDLKYLLQPCMCDVIGGEEKQFQMVKIKLMHIIEQNPTSYSKLGKQIDLSNIETAVKTALDLSNQLGNKPILPLIDSSSSVCNIEVPMMLRGFMLCNNRKKRAIEGQMIAELCIQEGVQTLDELCEKVSNQDKYKTPIVENYCLSRYNNYFEFNKFYQELLNLSKK